MKKITIIIMIMSVFSKVLGFAREIVLSTAYGASAISDAFIFSNSLANTIFSVIIAAFVTGLIPMYTKIQKQDGESEANLFINNVQNAMLIIGLFVSVFFFIFTEFCLGLLVPNASQQLLQYLIPFTKVTVFTVILTSFIQVLTGFLHIKSSFIVPIAVAFPTNIILIASILVSPTIGVMILPFSILLAYIAQSFIIYFYARKRGFRFKLYLNLKDKNLIMMLKLAVPLILGSATSTIGGLVNQGIASGTDGGISYINYATRIGSIIEGVFGLAIVSVMYPTLSKFVAEKDFHRVKKSFENSLTTLILFILPAAMGMLFLARPIVEFIYMRGEFTINEVNILMPVFITYSIGLVSYSTYGLIAKVFYSFQNTKTPMYIAIANISMQIVLGLVLSQILGLAGVTLAMAISSTFGVVLLLIFISKIFKERFELTTVLDVLKILVSSVSMGLIAFLVYRYASTHVASTMALVMAIVVGGMVYIGLVLALKINVVKEFIETFNNRKKTT